jgi:hypothetical protein
MLTVLITTLTRRISKVDIGSPPPEELREE